MPKSKSKRSRYQPPPRKKPKPSPRWYGVLLLALLFGGAGLIVLNYLGLIPGTNGTAANIYLFVGLALIALGFLGATRWH
jgi:LPXTG-motif cell wall-anchored protein